MPLRTLLCGLLLAACLGQHALAASRCSERPAPCYALPK